MSLLFWQQRVGKGGCWFDCCKIQTMRDGAEDEVPPNVLAGQKSSDDPRILPSRAWLRRFGLDELPQIWNIVKGEMCFCGPRPLPPAEFGALPKKQQELQKKYKPGVFGWHALEKFDNKKRSGAQLEYIYLKIRQKKERVGKVCVFSFHIWTATRCLMLIASGGLK